MVAALVMSFGVGCGDDGGKAPAGGVAETETGRARAADNKRVAARIQRIVDTVDARIGSTPPAGATPAEAVGSVDRLAAAFERGERRLDAITTLPTSAVPGKTALQACFTDFAVEFRAMAQLLREGDRRALRLERDALSELDAECADAGRQLRAAGVRIRMVTRTS